MTITQYITRTFSECYRQSATQIRPYLTNDAVALFKRLLISHLSSDNINGFKHSCIMVFELLDDFSADEKIQIYDSLKPKLNNADKGIRNTACVLTSNLLDAVPSSEHMNLMIALIKNMDLPPDNNEEKHIKDRVQNLMYSMLAHIAILGSTSIRHTILHEMLLRLVKPTERDIARTCILHIALQLTHEETNNLIYGVILGKIQNISVGSGLDNYYVDLMYVMVQKIKRSQESFELKNKVACHIIPDLSDIVVRYVMG